MLDYLDEIGLTYVIYFAFSGIIYLLGRIFGNMPLMRYAETLVKEGVMFAVLIGVTFLFYYVLYEYNAPAGFYDQLFDSSTGYAGTIYSMAINHLTNISILAQKALYFYTELEGRILHFSSFQCSGCPSGSGLTCLGNLGMVKTVYAYKRYIEPIHQTIASAKIMMEQTVRILFTFWILVYLANSPVFMALIPIAIIVRLLPGMKFAGNIMFSLTLAFVVVLPLLAITQAYIFYPSIQKLWNVYTTHLSVSTLPDYIDPTDILDMFLTIIGGCSFLAPYPPYLEYNGTDLVLHVQGYTITDRAIKETAQELFLISVFNLSAGVVGMIAFVKGVSELLGERNSFIDLFLRII